MNTKESILWNIPWDKEQKGEVPTAVIYEAMDKWAMQFAEWKDNDYRHLYVRDGGSKNNVVKKYYHIEDGTKSLKDIPTYTLVELYQLYIKETQKP